MPGYFYKISSAGEISLSEARVDWEEASET